MPRFSSGKNTFRCCDRCGFRYPYSQLRFDGNVPESRLLVCSNGCYDTLSPYLIIGRHKYNDPQAVRNPRPDIAQPTPPPNPAWPPPLTPPVE